MRRRISALACAIATACCGLLALPAAADASTVPPPVALPQVGSTFHQILADPAAGYLFLSQGQDSYAREQSGLVSTGIVVTDLSGKYVTTIDEEGAEGLALSADGSTLYAANGINEVVAAISVASIASGTVTETDYPLPSGDVPYGLALQGGELWVSYDHIQGTLIIVGEGDIGDFVLPADASIPSFEPQPVMSAAWYTAPEIAVDPAGSPVLVAMQIGLAPTQAYSYDISSATPAITAGKQLTDATGNDDCDYAEGLAVLAGGTDVVFSCGVEYSTATLAYQAPLPPGGATASAADGVLAIGGGSQLAVYRGSGATLVNKYALPAAMTVPIGGIAVTDGNSDVYAVVNTQPVGRPASYELQVLPDLTWTGTNLTLKASKPTVAVGKPVTVSGTLTLISGAAPPAGSKVSITRSGKSSATFSVPVAADGTFSMTDTPTAAGAYSYAAAYAGSTASSVTAASAPALVVKAVLATPSLGIISSAGNYLYGTTATVTVKLGPTFTNHAVTLYATPAGQARVRLAGGKVNSRGTLSVSYKFNRSTTFTAVFGGDARTAPRTVSRLIGSAAKVATGYSGWFKTTTFNGAKMHVFHHTGQVNMTVSVTPNKHGECTQTQVQQWDPAIKGWVANQTFGCLYLNKNSQLASYLTLASATGGVYRVRELYVRKTTDTRNADGSSGWFYLTVVN